LDLHGEKRAASPAVDGLVANRSDSCEIAVTTFCARLASITGTPHPLEGISMRHLLLASLLLVPAVAMADDQCKFHADRNLDLDLSGVRAVRFSVHSYELHLSGGAPAGKGTVRGKACASDQQTLDSLVVTQERDGDTLLVELKTDRNSGWSGFGSHYSDLKVEASVPSNIPVMVNVGSGEAKVRGVASLDSSSGSGELEASDIKGSVRTTVGSGEVKLDSTGPVEVDTVGSGDFEAKHVNGGVRIGTVGSGDAKLSDIGGNVDVGTIGSGDLNVDGVRGDLRVRTQGSGDVDHHGVTGRVDVPDKNR
jgi:hypothetical protein